MTPKHKIMATILLQGIESGKIVDDIGELTDDTVEGVFTDYFDAIIDEFFEFREGEFPTPGICKRWSRHYETTGVAAQMFDGSYVGWTYFTGGGKHGEPAEEPWIEDAYDLNCVEEEKLMIVRTFSLTE